MRSVGLEFANGNYRPGGFRFDFQAPGVTVGPSIFQPPNLNLSEKRTGGFHPVFVVVSDSLTLTSLELRGNRVQ